MRHPIILVPTSLQSIQDNPNRLYVNRAYASSIERAGGIVFGVARPLSDEVLDQLIAIADGLYITGGHDMDPKWYNEESRLEAKNDTFDTERDTLELELMKKALHKKMPIIGICRGMQNLNVCLGGTLYQDLKLDVPGTVNHDHREVSDRSAAAHDVNFNQETQLGKIVGIPSAPVNSLHHQGIKTLGGGLRIAAKAPDGLIEAIEVIDHPFAMGVQWHPEELHDEHSAKIFTEFIDAAKVFYETKNRS